MLDIKSESNDDKTKSLTDSNINMDQIKSLANSNSNLNQTKLKFSLYTDKKEPFKFTIFNEEDNITFIFESMKEFPVKIYEMKTSLTELKEKDDCFYGFKTAGKFISNGIKKSIESKKYNLIFSEDDQSMYFHMSHDIFDQDYVAKIKVPEKELDIKEQVDSLTKIVAKIKEKVNIDEKIEENVEKEKKEDKKIKEDIKKEEEKPKDEKLKSYLTKEDAAKNSFVGTSFLLEEEKILISKWIHPDKIIKFNLLYTNAKDTDSSSCFHYYCDGAFPTVTVVLDTSNRRFGGYSTQSWAQSTVGASYARAPGSFIFNLSKKQKYDLQDQFSTNAIYRHNSYGPTFGGGHDLNLANGCKSNSNSYCSKSNYITGNYDLLGGSGNTSFQVTYYEVYHILFE